MSRTVNQPTLGNYLREIRTEKGLSLKELGKSIDVDHSLLSKIERGERTLSMDLVPGLAKALKVDFKTLQTELLSLSLLEEYGAEEFASEGIKKALKRMVA